MQDRVLRRWITSRENSTVRWKDLRRIARWAAEIPDPVARLSYLRRSTAAVTGRWPQGRAIPWKKIAMVGGAAAVLAAAFLLWRTG